MPTVTIRARERWNDTGIDLVAGATYRLVATGRWRDWFIDTDADGFTRWYLRPFRRRVPGERWFKLIGCVGQDESRCFAIGKASTLVAPASGRLYCFANDAPSAYWNNEGELTLTVTPA